MCFKYLALTDNLQELNVSVIRKIIHKLELGKMFVESEPPWSNQILKRFFSIISQIQICKSTN